MFCCWEHQQFGECMAKQAQNAVDMYNPCLTIYDGTGGANERTDEQTIEQLSKHMNE